MKSKLNITIPTMLCISLQGITAPSYGAQSSSFPDTNSSGNNLESVTVTASHTPVSIRDTASAITLITKQEIDRRNATSLSDLLRNVPGFAVNQQGSRGALTQLRVRGSEANHVMVLVDGVNANDLSQGGQFNFAHLTTQGVEQIEIIRGPQSALWGANAMAGVVNIITTGERPAPGQRDNRNINGQLEFGSFGTNRWGVNLENTSGSSQIRFGLHGIETDGTNISRQGSEADGYKNTTFNLSGSTFFSDSILASINYRQTNSEAEFDDTDFVTTGLPVDAESKTDSEQRYLGASLGLTLLEGKVSQKFIASRVETDNENQTSSPVNDVTRGVRTGLRAQTDLFFSEHTFSFIAEFEEEDFVQRGAVIFGDPNRDESVDTFSVASEYRYNGDRIDFSASSRLDNNSDFDDAVSWRITTAWHASDVATLFGSIGEANTNPSFSERFGFFTNFQGNPNLKPEQSLSWELGLRSQFIDNIQLSASWFDATLEDEINGFVFDPTTFLFTADNRQGKSHRKGLEVSLAWRASERLDLQANYTWLEATEEMTSGIQRDEVRRPGNTGSVNANYILGKSNLNLNVSYNGEQFDDYFPPFPTPQEVVTLGSYTLVTLSYRYNINDALQLTTRLENLLDEQYEEVFGYRAPGLAGHLGISFQL